MKVYLPYYNSIERGVLFAYLYSYFRIIFAMRNDNYIELNNPPGYGIGLPSRIVPEMLPEILHTENPVELQFADYGGRKGHWTSYSYRDTVELAFDTKHFDSPLIGKLHKHDYFEIVLNTGAHFEMQIEGSLYELQHEDVCLLNRATRHAEHFQGKENLVYIVLSETYVRKHLLEKYFSDSCSIKLRNFFDRGLRESYSSNMNYVLSRRKRSDASVVEIIQEIKDEFSYKRPGYKLVIDGLLLRFLHIITDEELYCAEYIDLGADNGFALAQSAKAILDKTKCKMTLKELSAKLDYNEAYISRVFKQHYGYSISKYNQQICLEQAEFLLRSTQKSIQQICTAVGYQNRTAFYKLFYKKHHCSLLEYRQRSE